MVSGGDRCRPLVSRTGTFPIGKAAHGVIPIAGQGAGPRQNPATPETRVRWITNPGPAGLGIFLRSKQGATAPIR